jgi:hypothetical protein
VRTAAFFDCILSNVTIGFRSCVVVGKCPVLVRQVKATWRSTPNSEHHYRITRYIDIGFRGVVQIQDSLRNSHFGTFGQRPTPTTGHNIDFRNLRHVLIRLRPAVREGTRYTLLLFAGWGARGPQGGTSQILPFLVLDL